MKEFIIEKNDSNQRLDRFLGKYLNKAPSSFIQKLIRTKKVKVNKKRASKEQILNEGDLLNIYVYDEVLEGYIKEKKLKLNSGNKLDLIYDDENISIIYKKAGILVHPASKEDYGKTLVDDYIQLLLFKNEYVPRMEKSFTPAIVNRLDLNTSGLVIACKNSHSLRSLSKAIKEKKITKKYRTIVKGTLNSEKRVEKNLEKLENKNMVVVSGEGKDSETIFRPLKIKNGYTLIEAELITGRTHQIRAHLKSIGLNIVGDRKYGTASVNAYLKKEYALNNQYLIAYKLEINGLEDELSYLNGKIFEIDKSYFNLKLEEGLFG